jgi:hypothetical protein
MIAMNMDTVFPSFCTNVKLKSDTIVVNLTYPERNREVQVYCFESLRNPITGDIVDGFQIVINADIRDVAKDLYKAEIVSDNELLITIPSLSHQMVQDCALRHAFLLKLGLLCDRCQEGQEIAMTSMEDNPWRKLRQLRLRFPDHIVLANLHSTLDNVLTVQEEPYYTNSPFGGQAVFCSVTWKVASQDTRRKATGSAAKHAARRLEDMFTRMSTNDSRMSNNDHA